MKNESASNTPKSAFIWVYYVGSVEHKIPTSLMKNDHLLNTQKYLVTRRIQYKDLVRYHKQKDEISEGLENLVARFNVYIDWCNKWIFRFEAEIKKRKLKPLPPDINFGKGRGKSFDIQSQLKADEKYIKANGPSTI